MPADWTVVQGDTQPSFADTLHYGDGRVPPLGGATTIACQLRSLANTSVTTLTGTVTLVDPQTGDVVFQPTAADTTTPGNYLQKWVVTYDPLTGLGTQSFPTEGFNWVFIEPNARQLDQKVLSLGEVKKYLSIPANDRTRDADLLSLIDDVTPLVAAEVGPLIPTLYEEWHDGGSNTIALGRDPSTALGANPLIEIVAASEYRGPIEYPLALVASPVFGSIYSVMLVPDSASLTRRTAGGRTLAFMPGRESLHVWYLSGQDPIPGPVKRAVLEYLRSVYRWPQQTGMGSLSPADRMDAGAALQAELSRLVRMWTRPLRRYPSIA